MEEKVHNGLKGEPTWNFEQHSRGGDSLSLSLSTRTAAATARGYEAHLFVHFSSPHSSSSLHPDVVDAGFAHVASPPFGSGPATQVPV